MNGDQFDYIFGDLTDLPVDAQGISDNEVKDKSWFVENAMKDFYFEFFSGEFMVVFEKSFRTWNTSCQANNRKIFNSLQWKRSYRSDKQC